MSLWGGFRVGEFPVRENLDTHLASVFYTDSTPLCSCNHSRDERCLFFVLLTPQMKSNEKLIP